MYPADVSKYNSNHWKQVILLMFSNGEKPWHYHAVNKLSPILKEITYNLQGKLNCIKSMWIW